MAKTKHILVVGSGIAGLIAALELSRKHAVTLVTKAQLADSNTRWAQGGIAAVMFSDDSAASHIADTLAAGAGLCNPEAVGILCTEGPERIRDLIRLGVRFDQTSTGDLARGLEAAHSKPRILHAGGDATGLSIELALVHAVRAANITVLEHTFALDLVLHNGIVSGLEVIDPAGHSRAIDADAVILASGGAGQLYLHTTNPSVATGDGTALALRAGAQLADTEFYQFHPTALATTTAADSSPFLISEAVRGEGAVLLDIHGHRFMQDLHPSAELAPRDVVARGIARQMALQQGQPVLLDATALSAGFLARRFPSIDAATRARNLNWSREPIPVTPAGHYWMGGVRTDTHGRTSIPGLYAIGEVACTGVHGANRLASNSLLESLTFAWRCAHLFLNEASAPGLAADFSPLNQPRQLPGFSSGASTTPITRLDLQTLLWTHAGIERNATHLQAAFHTLSHSHTEGTTIYDLETANLLTLARMLVGAALAREESRGAHFRTDFPQPSTAFQHSLIYTHPQKAGVRTIDANQVAVPC
jgi:L-aspartate oxidase